MGPAPPASAVSPVFTPLRATAWCATDIGSMSAASSSGMSPTGCTQRASTTTFSLRPPTAFLVGQGVWIAGRRTEDGAPPGTHAGHCRRSRTTPTSIVTAPARSSGSGDVLDSGVLAGVESCCLHDGNDISQGTPAAASAAARAWENLSTASLYSPGLPEVLSWSAARMALIMADVAGREVSDIAGKSNCNCGSTS